MSANGGAFLSVKNIEVIYDHVILVLKGVSFDVAEGGIVALLGANGAGKTTTLKAISNLLRSERGDVTKGSIEYLGEPFVTSPRSERNKFEMAFNVVVFPAPFAPNKATIPPSATSKETPFKTRMTWS
jgi:ABC-type multidrug transport system ATPase subunit